MPAQPKCMPVAKPTYLPPKTMPLHLFTIGWQSCGAKYQHNFDKLIDYGPLCVSARAAITSKAMTGGSLIWFDARGYHNPYNKRALAYWHCGEHFEIMTRLTHHEEFPVFLHNLKDWMADIEIAHSPEMQARKNRAAFVSTSGTHMSVACARIAFEVLIRCGFNAMEPRHLSYGTWVKRNLCSKCDECNVQNPNKAAFFDWCYVTLMNLQ